MTNPLVSIIVPAFNVALTLEACVASIESTELGDVEVIIVDDASTDETADIGDELSRRLGVSIIHHVINTGVVFSRNDGLNIATGTFVLFLDGDDRLCPGALDSLLSEMNSDEVVGAAGRFRAVDEDGNDLDIGTWAHEQLRPVLRRHGRMVDSSRGLTAEAMLTRLVTPPPGAVLLRRSAVNAIGGFDPRVKRSEDLDLLVRIAALGRIVAVDATVLLYRRQASQRSASTRRRQFGRLWTLAMLIVRAPGGRAARVRGRGAAAHYLDRAETRWRYGSHHIRDVVSVSRSVLLSGAFRALGLIMRIVRWPL